MLELRPDSSNIGLWRHGFSAMEKFFSTCSVRASKRYADGQSSLTITGFSEWIFDNDIYHPNLAMSGLAWE
jgi:hypothetical protein